MMGKTYRDAQLEELVPSIAAEHALEHEIICGSELTGEKHGEDETTDEW
jgi:hypothetical protein